MLKAKLDSVRKNKKGFSLVELIIVIAIMVALIAVLAPAYIKYVQKSRDSALATAAEDLATAMKTYVADPDYGQGNSSTGNNDAMPTLANGTYLVYVSNNRLVFTSNGTQINTTGSENSLIKYAGIDGSKSMGKSENIWTITVSTKSYGKTDGQVVTGPVLSTSKLSAVTLP